MSEKIATVADLIAALAKYPGDMRVGYFESPGAGSFTEPQLGPLSSEDLRHNGMPDVPTLSLNIDH